MNRQELIKKLTEAITVGGVVTLDGVEYTVKSVDNENATLVDKENVEKVVPISSIEATEEGESDGSNPDETPEEKEKRLAKEKADKEADDKTPTESKRKHPKTIEEMIKMVEDGENPDNIDTPIEPGTEVPDGGSPKPVTLQEKLGDIIDGAKTDLEACGKMEADDAALADLEADWTPVHESYKKMSESRKAKK